MVERRVPKDIRSFKGKVFGSFTLRQVICITLAFVVDLGVYTLFLKDSNVSTDTTIMILMTCALPILAFIAEPSGMPMEVYVRKVLYKNILYPTKRKNRTDLNSYTYKITDSELKQINKEYKKQIKEEPEWKMYE